MAAKGTTFASDLLKLILNNTAIANVGDAGGLQPSATAGSVYVSLHTSSPGAGGAQNTNEAAYTGYARVAVARSAGGWTITSNAVSPTATIVFGPCTAGSETETHAGIGTILSGAGKLMWFGALSPTIPVSNGTTPEIPTTSTITET